MAFDKNNFYSFLSLLAVGVNSWKMKFHFYVRHLLFKRARKKKKSLRFETFTLMFSFGLELPS